MATAFQGKQEMEPTLLQKRSGRDPGFSTHPATVQQGELKAGQTPALLQVRFPACREPSLLGLLETPAAA